MKCKRVFVLAVLSLLVLGQCVFAAETNSVIPELNNLVTRINAKLLRNQRSENDLADELAEFDTLLTTHKGAPPQEIAEVFMAKVNLYIQVLQDPEKAVAVLKQFKTNLPMLEVNGNTDATIAMLQKSADTKKIQDALAVGTPFPGFDEKDMTGKPLSLENYKGKVVLIDFWATWCPKCVMELPHVLEVYKKHHDRGFEVIGISLDVDQAKLMTFTKQRGMTWPQYFDGQYWNNKLAVKYGIQAAPTTYLLDGEGKIIAKNLSGEELENAVAGALKKK